MKKTIVHPKHSVIAGPGCWRTSSSGKCNAGHATKDDFNAEPVRITHPFHPWLGRELDVLRRDIHYGEDRMFYRSRYGHVSSLPTAWTSCGDPPPRGDDGTIPLFLAGDLLELVQLVHQPSNRGTTGGRDV